MTTQAFSGSCPPDLIQRLSILPLDRLQGKRVVIKVGGSLLANERDALHDAVWLWATGAQPVLVHGGGLAISAWLHKLNVPTRFENGMRVTDAQTLEVVRMVLLGQVNPALVLQLTQLGAKAIGLCGTDKNMVHARRASERLGLVGEVESIDPTPIESLLAKGYLPIVAPLACGPGGSYLNVNADQVAAHLAGSLQAELHVILSDVAGVCRPDGSVIPTLTLPLAQQLLAQNIIHGGMIPKMNACLAAAGNVSHVHILDGREPHVILRLLAGECLGTRILPR